MARHLRTSLSALAVAGLLILPLLLQPLPVQAGGERLVLAFYYAWFDHKT